MPERIKDVPEQAVAKSGNTVEYPAYGKIEIGPLSPFTIISRTDRAFAVGAPSAKIARAHNLHPDSVNTALGGLYDTFTDVVTVALSHAFSQKPGGFRFHSFEQSALDRSVVARAEGEGAFIVSLDPLVPVGEKPFGVDLRVSRGHFLGARTDHDLVARPGSMPLDEQINAVASKVTAHAEALGTRNPKIVLLEDDSFTGGTLVRGTNYIQEVVKQCRGLGVSPELTKIFLGIQVGAPTKITALGIPIDTVVEYTAPKGMDIFEKVEYLDIRDTAFGFEGSGFVVRLPDGTYGRAPIPFGSGVDRASIPPEKEKDFIEHVLSANLSLFQAYKDKTGKDIQLQHMSPDFSRMLLSVYGARFGVHEAMPMTEVVQWTRGTLEEIQQYTKELEAQQKAA